MPRLALRSCLVSGCTSLVASGCCSLHHREQRWPDVRPSAAERGYDDAWRDLRKIILARDPVCTICYGEVSTDVDHLVSRARGGTNHPLNLRGLCHSCHSRKTAQQDGRWGRR